MATASYERQRSSAAESTDDIGLPPALGEIQMLRSIPSRSSASGSRLSRAGQPLRIVITHVVPGL